MAYQEVKTENYGTRLPNSFKGILMNKNGDS